MNSRIGGFKLVCELLSEGLVFSQKTLLPLRFKSVYRHLLTSWVFLLLLFHFSQYPRAIHALATFSAFDVFRNLKMLVDSYLENETAVFNQISCVGRTSCNKFLSRSEIHSPFLAVPDGKVISQVICSKT